MATALRIDEKSTVDPTVGEEEQEPVLTPKVVEELDLPRTDTVDVDDFVTDQDLFLDPGDDVGQNMTDSAVAETMAEFDSQDFSVPIEVPDIPEPGDNAGDLGDYWEGQAPIPVKVVRQVADGLTQLVGGPRDAANEMFQVMYDANQWFGHYMEELVGIEAGSLDVETGFELTELPEVREPTTTTGEVVRPIAQFLIPFAGWMKVLSTTAKSGKYVNYAVNASRAQISGALTDAFSFDPMEANLFNLLDEWEILQGPVLDMLTAEEGDDEVEMRAKAALGGMGIGVLVDGFGLAIKAIRSNRRATGIKALTGGEDVPNERITQMLGDPDQPLVSNEVAQRFSRDEIDFDELMTEVNWAAMGKNGESMQTGITSLVKITGKRLEQRVVAAANDVTLTAKTRVDGVEGDFFTVSRKGEDLGDVIVRGVEDGVLFIEGITGKALAKMNLGSGGARQFLRALAAKYPGVHSIEGFRTGGSYVGREKIKRITLPAGDLTKVNRGIVTDEMMADFAERMNLSVPEMMARAPGEVWAAENIFAAHMLLDSAQGAMFKAAKAAKLTTDDVDIWSLMKMINTYEGLKMQLRGIASESGRALRAHRRDIRHSSGATGKMVSKYVNREVDNLLAQWQIPEGNAAWQANELQRRLIEHGGHNKVKRLAILLDELAETASDPTALRKAIDNTLKGSPMKRMGDMLIELWYFNLLSGPATHIVNTASSALNMMWQIPERALATRVSALRGSDDMAIGEASEMGYAMIASFFDATRAAGRVLKSGRQTDFITKADLPVRRSVSAENFGIGGSEGSVGKAMALVLNGMGEIIRSPNRAIMTVDEFFQVMSRTGEMRALSFRQAKKEGLYGERLANRIHELMLNPSQVTKQDVVQFGREITFTQPLGNIGQKLQGIVNSYPVLKLFVPFMRTGTNLVKWGLNRTPLAALNRQIRKDIAAGGAKGNTALARMMMGTALMSVAANEVWNGNITGRGPFDPELRAIWLLTHQPYSFKLGGEWYSYNRSDPFGAMIGAAASYGELFGPTAPEDIEDLGAAVMTATTESVMNKTWMSGPSALFDAISQPHISLDNFLERMTGSLIVPAILANAARSQDPIWRDVDSIADAIYARIPGYSKTLPPMRNIWGEAIMHETLGPNAISPIYKFGAEPRPVDDWLFENRVDIQRMSRTQYDGIELTPEQYSRLVQLAGNEMKMPGMGNLGLYDMLNELVTKRHNMSVSWEMATDGPEGGRALILKRIVQAYRSAAKIQLLEEFPDLKQAYFTRQAEKVNAVLPGALPEGGIPTF